MTGKDEILKKLAKKTKEYKEYRDRSLGYVRPEKLVLEFIQAIEKARLESKVGLDFTQEVDRAYNVLVHRVQRWDKHAFVEIIWDREEQAEVWTDLRPSGIRIVWSEVYQKKNPGKDAELFIGVESLLIDETLGL